MKDLTLTNVNGALVASFRTEMLSNVPSNISIIEIRDNQGKQVDNLVIGGTIWRKLSYSWQAFLAFCTAQNLKISAADSNGSNGATLLNNQVPAGTKYPIVSANSGTKTILVATDVHAAFLTGASITIYNADNSVFGNFTENGNSVYGAPNTSIVVNEVLADIAANSGKYIIHN